MKFFKYIFVLVVLLLIEGVGYAQNEQTYLWASSYLGKTAPTIEIKYWLAKRVPNLADKPYVLLVFWTPESSDTPALIDSLNIWQHSFKHSMQVLALTSAKRNRLKPFLNDTLEFYIGLDIQRQMYKKMRISALPYAVLIDEQQTVIWEGYPFSTAKPLNQLVIGQLLTE